MFGRLQAQETHALLHSSRLGLPFGHVAAAVGQETRTHPVQVSRLGNPLVIDT